MRLRAFEQLSCEIVCGDLTIFALVQFRYFPDRFAMMVQFVPACERDELSQFGGGHLFGDADVDANAWDRRIVLGTQLVDTPIAEVRELYCHAVFARQL